MKEAGKKVIHVSFSPAEVDPVYFPQLNVVGDITSTMFKLSEIIKKQESWNFGFLQKSKERS